MQIWRMLHVHNHICGIYFALSKNKEVYHLMRLFTFMPRVRLQKRCHSRVCPALWRFYGTFNVFNRNTILLFLRPDKDVQCISSLIKHLKDFLSVETNYKISNKLKPLNSHVKIVLQDGIGFLYIIAF